MDNRTLDVISEGNDALRLAVDLAVNGNKATHYVTKRLLRRTKYFDYEDKEKRGHYTETVEDPKGADTLILLWHEETGATKLPIPLNADDVFGFVSTWLKNSADFGHEPDHDGDNGRGFRVFTEGWGHVAGFSSVTIAVQPAWAMYGK